MVMAAPTATAIHTIPMKIRTRIFMDDALLKLATWLSPSFPVGAFSYSHGLEWAIQEGDVMDLASAQAWIDTCLRHGAARTDAILLVHAMRGDDVEGLDALARALAPSRERALETIAQGAAFAATVKAAWGGDPAPRAYPVAVGIAARDHDCPERETLTFYLHAFVANLVSACIRLVPLGQTEGQRIIGTLHPAIGAVADEALTASLDDIGGCAMLGDVATMRHETQTVRLFRS